MFSDDESDGGADDGQDELDHYLKLDPERKVKNPILWWEQNARLYPRLSRMALDYLSRPGE